MFIDDGAELTHWILGVPLLVVVQRFLNHERKHFAHKVRLGRLVRARLISAGKVRAPSRIGIGRRGCCSGGDMWFEWSEGFVVRGEVITYVWVFVECDAEVRNLGAW